jgi:hypothetical protein
MTKHERGTNTSQSTVPDGVISEREASGLGPTPEVGPRVADSEEAGLRAVGWSIRRAIELLDEAIDGMGRRLARPAALDWSDEPVGSQSRRPDARVGRRPEVGAITSTPDQAVDLAADVRGPELP